MTSTLDRFRYLALVLGTSACLAPGPDLPTHGQKFSKRVDILVINLINTLLTE